MQSYTAPQLISIDEIDATDRLRPLDTDWVEGLAASIAKKGSFTRLKCVVCPVRPVIS